MGRFVKNRELRSAGYTVRLPLGSNTVGPASPVVGDIRYNTSIDKIEYYSGSAWKQLTKEGNATIVKDTFTGNGIVQDFTPMSYSYTAGQEAQVLVFLNTVFQDPGINYTFNGTNNIHFTSTPGNLASIVVLHNFASTTPA